MNVEHIPQRFWDAYVAGAWGLRCNDIVWVSAGLLECNRMDWVKRRYTVVNIGEA